MSTSMSPYQGQVAFDMDEVTIIQTWGIWRKPKKKNYYTDGNSDSDNISDAYSEDSVQDFEL